MQHIEENFLLYFYLHEYVKPWQKKNDYLLKGSSYNMHYIILPIQVFEDVSAVTTHVARIMNTYIYECCLCSVKSFSYVLLNNFFLFFEYYRYAITAIRKNQAKTIRLSMQSMVNRTGGKVHRFPEVWNTMRSISPSILDK